jgi:hypothetical protein
MASQHSTPPLCAHQPTQAQMLHDASHRVIGILWCNATSTTRINHTAQPSSARRVAGATCPH